MQEFVEVVTTAGWLSIIFLAPSGILWAILKVLDIYTELAYFAN